MDFKNPTITYLTKRNKIEAGQMAQLQKPLALLPEDVSSVLSTHTNLSFRDPMSVAS